MRDLTEVIVGDRPDAWAGAGFALSGDAVVLGGVRLVLRGADGGDDGGDDGPRGLLSVAVAGIEEDIDGIAVHRAEPAADHHGGPPHPNAIDGIDHLVVTTPDCDRTTAALEAAGLEVRRVRRLEAGGRARRQTFFWLGQVILELVGPDDAVGDGPAALWGLALVSPDLDATVAALGPHSSPARPAVQQGRRITTIETRELDISVPLAVMSPHQR